MMEDRKNTEEKIALLRKRSKTGYINQVMKKISSPEQSVKKTSSEEEYQEILNSIFDN